MISSYMRKVLILAALSVIACSKATEEKVYTEAELGVYIDWAYLGWSEVYNNLDGTVTLVTTYPDVHYSEKTIEKTFVINLCIIYFVFQTNSFSIVPI